jgi:excisionase family DNA binding protein
MTERRCLKPREYAAERRIDLKTLYRLIKAGKVPAERVGGQWRIWLGGKPTRSPNA